jgi:VanZ family protein
MEFVQKYCVVNRSFDIGDIIADSIGAILGFGCSYKTYLKK